MFSPASICLSKHQFSSPKYFFFDIIIIVIIIIINILLDFQVQIWILSQHFLYPPRHQIWDSVSKVPLPFTSFFLLLSLTTLTRPASINMGADMLCLPQAHSIALYSYFFYNIYQMLPCFGLDCIFVCPTYPPGS